MTIDRAIEILNPEHRENYDGFFPITHWMPLPEPPEEGGNGNG